MDIPVILMIRPVRFGFNAQTAVNNAFQHKAKGEQVQSDQLTIQAKALNEFDTLVKRLKDHNISVLVIDDTTLPHTPDSIFPNNWISFHEDGSLILYPMFAENRRLERKAHVLEAIYQHFEVKSELDWSNEESNHRFLEGTGSMVLDRSSKIAYACRSERTDDQLFEKFCRVYNYEPVLFDALGADGTAIYHTNVLMCVADRYVVINLQSIDSTQRDHVRQKILDSGKFLLEISIRQMEAFAGNMLQVFDMQRNPYLVMSTSAYDSLSIDQRIKLEEFNPIIHAPLSTIEYNGGGSARCMMAEVFLKSN